MGGQTSSSIGAGALGPSPGLVDTRAQYDHVFGIYVPIALGVFALVLALTLGAVISYRRRPIERAARWHEHNQIEGAYALVLACAIAFLLYVTFGAEHEVDTVSARERPSLVVDVTGSQWQWRFYYPAYGIERLSGTVGSQDLVVPANEAIRFRMVTRDVIHAFWIPQLRYKHDLIPGSVQEATLTFAHTGVFGGQCAEFCGLYHSRMTFHVRVVSPARFAAWARERRADASGAPRR